VPRTAALVAVALGLALAGCTGGDDGGDGGDPAGGGSATATTASPADVLAEAQRVLDAAPTLHLELTGEDLPATGTVVLGAEGDAQRPGSFAGDLRVQLGATAATVAVISIDGQVWAKLPLTPDFLPVDPDALGINDPATLVAPGSGLSSLLTAGTDPTAVGEVRVGSEVLDEYEVGLPSSALDGLLPVTDPAAEVQARFAVDPESREVRRAVLTGPFYTGGAQTYTALLTDYGAPVDIRAP
jgi:lipoprotein LprG